jgi:hypothetical protein
MHKQKAAVEVVDSEEVVAVAIVVAVVAIVAAVVVAVVEVDSAELEKTSGFQRPNLVVLLKLDKSQLLRKFKLTQSQSKRHPLLTNLSKKQREISVMKS